MERPVPVAAAKNEQIAVVSSIRIVNKGLLKIALVNAKNALE